MMKLHAPVLQRPATRRSALVVAAAALALSACGGTTASSPTAQDDAAEVAARSDAAAPDRPDVALAPDLPPAPAPATFDVANLAEKVTPTVVNIITVQHVGGPVAEHPFDFFFGPDGPRTPGGPPSERQGAGTGFLIDANGYIVTNEHVVRNADEVTVKLSDDRELPAEVVGRDPKLDLALLLVKNARDLPYARLGSSESLRIGEHVLAVGNPFGLGHTVTLGIVSAKARAIGAGPYDDFIQTDAAINPGNSGGPLFNWRGEVVGINTAIRPGANSIGFAIPIDALRDVLDQLRQDGRVTRGKLGLAFQPITPELATALGMDNPRGALVAAVEPNGPAARAGIQPGDVVVAVGGTEIAHAEELPRNVARNRPGTKLAVSLLRGGAKREVTATLTPLDDAPLPGRPSGKDPAALRGAPLGLRVSPARGGGVRVDSIEPPGSSKELREGDVLLEVAGRPVEDDKALAALAAKAKSGEVLLAKIRRGGATRFAAITVP